MQTKVFGIPDKNKKNKKKDEKLEENVISKGVDELNIKSKSINNNNNNTIDNEKNLKESNKIKLNDGKNIQVDKQIEKQIEPYIENKNISSNTINSVKNKTIENANDKNLAHISESSIDINITKNSNIHKKIDNQNNENPNNSKNNKDKNNHSSEDIFFEKCKNYPITDETMMLFESIRDEVIQCLECNYSITSEAETYYCRDCKSLFHLACIYPILEKIYISNFTNYTFTCKGCKSDKNLNYYPKYDCYCGKYYPETKKGNKYVNTSIFPHGCGLICNENVCQHIKCSLYCHPGSHQLCDTKECKNYKIKEPLSIVKIVDKTTPINLKGKMDIYGPSCELIPNVVYCGRQNTNGGWNLKESIWANPFKVTENEKNEEVCEKYEAYLRKKESLVKALPGLVGKKLACWCAPLPCHTMVLIKLMKEKKLIK